MNELDLSKLSQSAAELFEIVGLNGADYLQSVQEELRSSTIKGGAGLVLSGTKAVVVSGWREQKSRRENAKFRKAFRRAASKSEREEAIRELLRGDPKLAAALDAILKKREFVRGVAAYTQHLPSIGFFENGQPLDELFVESSIRRLSDGLVAHVSPGSDPINEVLQSRNHLIEGAAGTGKSTLVRKIVTSYATTILNDPDSISFSGKRIPIFLNAKDLSPGDLTTSIQKAVSAIPFFVSTPLPIDFFSPANPKGHPAWLIVIDGLDEIKDRQMRQFLWNAVTQVHSQIGGHYQFIVTSRPGFVETSEADQNFECWEMLPLGNKAIKRLLRSTDPKALPLPSNGKAHNGAFQRHILSIPLFAAIAAYCVSEEFIGEFNKLNLLQFFVESLIRKYAPDSEEKQLAMESLVMALASRSGLVDQNFISANRGSLSRIVPSFSRNVDWARDFKAELSRSGIASLAGDNLEFSHELIRHYLCALNIFATASIKRGFWNRHNPIEIGWETVELLCSKIVQQNFHEHVEILLELLIFGETAKQCLTNLCISYPDKISEIAFSIVKDDLFEESETGYTISLFDRLELLLPGNKKFASQLVDFYLGHKDGIAAIEIVLLVMRAGHHDQSVDILFDVASGDLDEWYPARVSAISGLIELGHFEEIEDYLIEISSEADSLFERAEAATLLYLNHSSAMPREKLHTVIYGRIDPHDDIHDSTLADLLQAGETELVLPLLRPRIEAIYQSPNNAGFSHSVELHDALEAIRTIGHFFDKDEAVSSARSLLDAKTIRLSLRQTLDVCETLESLYPGSAAKLVRDRIHGLTHDDEVDWAVLGFLNRNGFTAEAEVCAEVFLSKPLDDHSAFLALSESLDELVTATSAARVTEFIKSWIPLFDRPELIGLLPRTGALKEALQLLKSQYDGHPGGIASVDVAVALCRIGEVSDGLRLLTELLNNESLPFDVRKRAAKAIAERSDLEAGIAARRTLVSDKSLSISERTEAARDLDEEYYQDGPAIWEALEADLSSQDTRIGDKISILRALELEMTEEKYEYDAKVLAFWIEKLLVHPDLTEEQCLRCLELTTATNGWVAVEPALVRLREFRTSKSSIFRRVDALLGLLSRWRRLPHSAQEEIEASINEAIEEPDCPLRVQVKGPRSGDNSDLPASLSSDPNLPPEWRIHAAGVGRHPFSRFDSSPDPEALLKISKDSSVTAKYRIRAAVEAVKSPEFNLDDALGDIPAFIPSFGNEAIEIARFLLEQKLANQAQDLITQIDPERDLSLYDRLTLAELWVDLGAPKNALEIASSIANLAEAVLYEDDDSWVFVQTAKLLAKLGRPDTAEELFRVTFHASKKHEYGYTLSEMKDAGFDELHQECLATANQSSSSDEQGGGYNEIEVLRRLLESDPERALTRLFQIIDQTAQEGFYRVYALKIIFDFAIQNQIFELAGDARNRIKFIAKETAANDVGFMLSALKATNQEYELYEILADPATVEALDFRHFEEYKQYIPRSLATQRINNGPKLATLDTAYQDDDFRRIEREFGEDSCLSLLRDYVSGETEDVIDRLQRAGTLVERYGDPKGLRYISELAKDAGNVWEHRLEATRWLWRIGFRELALSLTRDLSHDAEVDHYWIADLLFELGDIRATRRHLELVVAELPEGYREQVGRLMAAIGATDLLDRLADE